MRLLVLWLTVMPIGMLAIAILFAVIAINRESWAMLGIMIVMAVMAVVLFVTQRRLINRYLSGK